MNRGEAYKIESFSMSFNSEVRRLKAQVDLFWGVETEFYGKAGLLDGMTVLECGCGPGFLIDKLAQAFPNCRFTGIEIDPKLVDVFKERINENGFGNVDCRQGSVMQTDLPDESFDFIICRLVLEHLSDPLGAIREMARILKSGGSVVFIDNDFDFHLRTFPHIPELSDLYDAYCRARIAEGGNPRIGRQLPDLLCQAGFTDIHLELLCAHSQSSGDTLFLQSEGVGISTQLVRDGFLERNTLDVITAKWQTVLNTKQHCFFRQLFAASGLKSNSMLCSSATAGLEKDQDQSEIVTVTSHAIPQQVVPKLKKDGLEWLERHLAEWVAEILGLDSSEIERHVALEEYGLDSLAAMEVQKNLFHECGVHVEIASFFEKQTIIAIADYVWFLIYEE